MTISNIKSSFGVSSLASLKALGLCLAKTQVGYFDYDSIDEEGIVVEADEEGTITSAEVPDNLVLGPLIEFEVVYDAQDGGFILRSTLSTNSSPYGSPTDSMTALVGNHPRGMWDHSTLAMDCGTFDLDPESADPHELEIGYCEDNGPEKGAFPGDDTNTKENAGLYGADLVYFFNLVNIGNQSYPRYAYIYGRGTEEPYFGGAQVALPNDTRPKGGIPAIGADIGLHFVRLFRKPGSASEIALTLQSQQSKYMEIRVANGGACSTPFNIMLTGLTATGNEEPEL